MIEPIVALLGKLDGPLILGAFAIWLGVSAALKARNGHASPVEILEAIIQLSKRVDTLEGAVKDHAKEDREFHKEMRDKFE